MGVSNYFSKWDDPPSYDQLLATGGCFWTLFATPKGWNEGPKCSRKDAVQLEEKVFWCLLGSLEVLDNITIVPGLTKNSPSTPIQEVFFSPPLQAFSGRRFGGPPKHQGICKTIGVDRHHLRKPSNSESPHQNEKMTHPYTPVLTVCCRFVPPKKDEWNMDFSSRDFDSQL